MANRLINESSPYLRQHAHNPVDWYPWGEEAFSHAREQDKPIHLSIGYAACHWCHVMAHESFENPKIAELMNERFINIKVDRQERPDIDEIYQKAIQMMGQNGGWPLTILMTPQGEPFFGGTYFPAEESYGRPGFTRVILGISDAWQHNRQAIQENVEQLLKGYQVLENHLKAELLPQAEATSTVAAQLLALNTDNVYGGLGSAPKFPNPSCYDLILRIFHRTEDPALLHALTLTLDGMAHGGLYDHLAGGFARYSVDERWAVPHFEKMLYDNGQLVKLYADAYRATGKELWRHIFEHTIRYVLQEMAHPEGAFFASEDADSEGEEGKYYVWAPAEIKAILGEAAGAFVCRAYGVTDEGNFEHGKSVLYRAQKLEVKEEAYLTELSQTLLAARAMRVRPNRDENILTSWNALMIQGLCAAYQATGNIEYLTAARRAADFILQHLFTTEGQLYRTWKDGKAKIPGFLDDYAFLANALLDLYESCFEKNYLVQAQQLADLILDKFWDDGFYFTARDAEKLVVRPRIPHDNAIPSGMSASVFVLFRLFELTTHTPYRTYAQKVYQLYGAAAAKNPFGFAHLLAAQDFARSPLTIVLAGNKHASNALVSIVHQAYLPSHTIAFADDVPIGEGRVAIEGQLTAYVCQNQTCSMPVTSTEEFRKSIKILRKR